MGAGISKQSLTFTTFAHEVILVTTPEPTALMDACRVMKALSLYKLKDNIKVVVNQVQDLSQGEETYNKLLQTANKFLNLDIESLGFVFNDIRVGKAIMEQVPPIVLRYPNALASKNITEISRRILGDKDYNNNVSSFQQLSNRLIRFFWVIFMDRFKLNSKIELITEDNEIATGLIYDTMEDKVHVSIPSDDRQFKLFRVGGDMLKGIVYSGSETIGFNCIVTDRIYGDFPIYELSEIDNFMKVQRRGDVRVSFVNPMQYTGNRFLINIGNSETSPQKVIENIGRYLKDGMMLDLSGGGLKLSCYENFDIGKMLLLIFDLDDDTFILKGRIKYKELNTIDKRLNIFME